MLDKMADLEYSMLISNKDSETIYPDNTPYFFLVELPNAINLPGVWTCSVDGVYSSGHAAQSPPSCIHILLDFLRPSIAYNTKLRIGGTFPYQKPSSDIAFTLIPSIQKNIQVDRQTIRRIEVAIVSDDNKFCEFLQKKTTIALTFRKKHGDSGQ